MERFFKFTAAILGAAWLSWAQDDTPTVEETLTVATTKADVPLAEIDHQAIVLSAEDIERHQWKNLADVLHHLPGISLVRNGGDGSLTTLFVRGANPEHTLVLLNGVKLSDASAPNRRFDFGHLSTQGIERIEYLPGPQNTLYGSAASAGVIHIITKRPSRELDAGVTLEGGTGDNGRVGLDARASIGRFGYAVSAERHTSESISAGFDPRTGANPAEEDGYDQTNAQLNLSYRWDRVEVGLDAHYLDGDLDLDKFPFNFVTFAQDFADDTNLTSAYRQAVYRLHADSRHWEDRWRQSIILGRSEIERRDVDGPDAFHPPGVDTTFVSEFEGFVDRAEWRHNLDAHERFKGTFGLEYEEEESEDQNQSADTTSLFGQVRLGLGKSFKATFGTRYDDHSNFGEALTYTLAPVYQIPVTRTRLHATWGTGFNAPSLFQLHDTFFGSTTLREEESETWEAGISQPFLEGRLKLKGVYYESDYEDLIDFAFDQETGLFGYVNRPRAEMSGMVLSAAYRQGGWGLHLSYDNLFKARNRATPQESWRDLVRRASDKLDLRLDYRFGERYLLNLEALRYGESTDFDFFDPAAPVVTLDDYLLLNLGLTISLRDAFTLTLRGENLLDETYTQVIGYQVYGARAFLGLRYRY